jgi:hypothetical protein
MRCVDQSIPGPNSSCKCNCADTLWTVLDFRACSREDHKLLTQKNSEGTILI